MMASKSPFLLSHPMSFCEYIKYDNIGKPVTTATQMLESMVGTGPFFEVH